MRTSFVEAVIERTLSIVGEHPVCLTSDTGCLDPAASAPRAGTPVCSGIVSWQAQNIIRGLTDLRFKEMDLVEVAPARDVGEITFLAGTSIMSDLICLLAQQNKTKMVPLR